MRQPEWLSRRFGSTGWSGPKDGEILRAVRGVTPHFHSPEHSYDNGFWPCYFPVTPRSDTMIARCYLVLWLGLSLVACDKAPKLAGRPDRHDAAPRVARPAADEPSPSREPLREQMQRARQLATPDERNQALAAAVWEALELDPELAREGFDQLSDGSTEKNRLVEHYALRMAEQDVDDALQWAAALATEEDKSLAFGSIALVLAEKAPEQAAQLLSDSGVGGREFDVAVVQVVQRWAAQSPEQAAAWVAQFDAGAARRDGLKAVVGVWVMADLQGVMSWLAEMPDGAIQQEAVLGMAQTLADQPPERQAEWLRRAPGDLRSQLEKLRAAGE